MSSSDTPAKPASGPTVQRPVVQAFHEARTSSVQYVVADAGTKACAIIDPVLDFDEKSGSVATRSADEILSYVKAEGLTVEWILETHPHADHLSASAYLAERTGAPMAIGRHITQVQALWKDLYDLDDSFACDGSQWDRLVDDGDAFQVGALSVRVMHVPGHTLASVAYLIGDAAFINDTLFMPDGGSARADFPGGDAHQLWQSIQAILSLPGHTRLFTGHDYQPGGRPPQWESTVDEQRRLNAHVAGHDAQSYVRMRSERDGTLSMPKLILPALQVNLRAGRLPEPEREGRRFLKIPLNCFPDAVWGNGS